MSVQRRLPAACFLAAPLCSLQPLPARSCMILSSSHNSFVAGVFGTYVNATSTLLKARALSAELMLLDLSALAAASTRFRADGQAEGTLCCDTASESECTKMPIGSSTWLPGHCAPAGGTRRQQGRCRPPAEGPLPRTAQERRHCGCGCGRTLCALHLPVAAAQAPRPHLDP